jgi:hypothetical protein
VVELPYHHTGTTNGVRENVLGDETDEQERWFTVEHAGPCDPRIDAFEDLLVVERKRPVALDNGGIRPCLEQRRDVGCAASARPPAASTRLS